MNTVAGLPPGALEFALSHAVNLAEAGSSIEERKAGTFCVDSIHVVCRTARARVPFLLRDHAPPS
jgi:hypothetical protein